MNAIEVEGLSHSFGRRTVLEGVSFTVAQGSLAALAGSNGAGKSTLMALLANLYGVRHGRIRIFGQDLPRRAAFVLARTGLVFQQPSLDLDLTVAENLTYHAALHGMSRRKAMVRIEEELERQGLRGRIGEQVRRLSGGQRRRVEIARALLTEPQLLLLDEPASSLDAEGRAALFAHLTELRRRRLLTVLMTSHHADDVAGADLHLQLSEGRLA